MSTAGPVDGIDLQVAARRAIEALRAGVPNRDAVRALSTSQHAAVSSFQELLDGVGVGVGVRRTGPATRGMLVGGGFGSGKSHLLEHFAHLALEANFIVSKVVVSKETPLHDPTKMLRAAAESARAPHRQGAALPEIASTLDLESWEYADHIQRLGSPASGLNQRFDTTLRLFTSLRHQDPDFADLIVRFWAGDQMGLPELRRRLRETGETARVEYDKINSRDLSLERFRFLSRLMAAAGYAGWVVLIDEVELIGRYSLLQRAKAYGEVARWTRGQPGEESLPLAAVLAISDDFDEAVLRDENDLQLIPERLRSRRKPADDLLAGQAETGMRVIEREVLALEAPGPEVLDLTYRLIKGVHGEAYGWDPPDVEGLERDASTRMRQYVRAWINEWDLRRLDAGYQPSTEITELHTDYREDPDGRGHA